MADVFISYAREDRARAEQIARALVSAGIDTFWDTEIPPGKTWADYIEAKLGQSKVMLVLWSAHSTKSQWVREDARMGRDGFKLIPVMLDASAPPFGFGEVQGANLAHWSGDENDTEWKRVRAAIDSKLGARAEPPRAPVPPPMSPPIPRPPMSMQTAAPYFANMIAANPSADAHTPLEYIKKCLRHYVDGKGRARRSEFWWFALFQLGVMFAAAFIDITLFGINPYTGIPNALLFYFISGLALVCPSVSVAARRFHDVGLNGWLVALGYVLVVLYVGALFIIVVAFIPGQPGTNKYGPNPKGV